MENTKVKIYIDSPKPFYYPGEQLLASIFIDVLETVNCNKMTITTKGKEIIKATINYLPLDIEEYEESEEEDQSYSNDVSRTMNKNEIYNTTEKQKSLNEIAESKTIFKYKKTIQLSNNNELTKGKYIYPLEIDIPKNIPGSFLYLDINTYAEIIYSIKIKLDNIDIKEVIPLIIRQKEKLFHYPKENEYSKNIGGCCWEKGETSIKLNVGEKYFLGGNKVNLNVILNNEKSGMQGTPINVEIYQKLILFPKENKKKIKRTKLVGKFKGKKKVIQREIFNEDVSFSLNENKYIMDNLSKTKSNKYFKNNTIIPLLTQSIKSNLIICEYELYAESQFVGWSINELGVFLKVLMYPPEKGILMNNSEELNKEFSNGLMNKKIFLNNEEGNNENDELKNNEMDEINVEDEKKNIKKNKKPKKHKFDFTFKKSDYKYEDKENKDMNQTYDINNDDINQNFNINNFKNNLNYLSQSEKNKINNDEIFKVSKKKKYNNKIINSIKKNFSHNNLKDDAIDNEFLENPGSN